MATLVLSAVGSAAGNFIAGPIGSIVGQALGSLGGSLLQPGASTSPQMRVAVGPRLTKVAGVTSMEGAPIPRVYGRARLGGQMIWASRFIESTNVSPVFGTGRAGGKGSAPKPVIQPVGVDITYSYYANIAIGLCEGPVAFVRRVWADGQELDVASVTMRVHRGDEAQAPDPLISAIEHPGTVPAYRGLCYVVFERLPLAKFGNRVPQFSFEVVRPVDGLGAMISAVDIIPGATEFGYQPALHTSIPGPGTSVQENRNQSWAATDWRGSIDALQALCPNLTSVALVVTWFGDDLRAGYCKIAPRIDNTSKTLSFPFVPVVVQDWSVAGLSRGAARLVTQIDGSSAYGGTPSDESVVAAIQDLKTRGLSVTLYPFVMMDIPYDNGLQDPWTGEAGQPSFPWRGRITCDPAPERPGTVDGTAVAAAQVSSFFGSSAPAADEWSYRRFILHCVDLCVAAGGVDAFLIGSELAALTRIRSAPGVYPAAWALAQLAADAKGRLGAQTKISYAADWTEYGAHTLNGGAEVRFPLDPVWSSPNVDFVGIDAYWPLSDWRDGPHLDQGEADTVYDLDYLTRRIGAGEAYDWYYADETARNVQARTPITDGAAAKPWVFRQKDIVNWWSHQHFERVGGVEIATPTAWAPQSKPIWIVETGCPAVDRGANAPNVFPDAKSSEGGVPHFSRGFRDDLMQARFLEAMITRFDPAAPGFRDAWNPVSSVYGGRMVDPARVHIWAWDARPFPAFPDLGALWTDAVNWQTGHWINGRIEGAPLDRLLTELAATSVPASASSPRPDVIGYLDGYVLDRAMSARAAIEPLGDLFAFDPVFSGGAVRFLRRSRAPALALGQDDLVPGRDGALVRYSRAQESEIPHEIALTFGDADNDYGTATVLSRRVEGWSRRRAETETAVMTNRGLAQQRADIWLADIWRARETVEFQAPPSLVVLEAGDVVTLDSGAGPREILVTSITDGATRQIAARAIDRSDYDLIVPTYTRRAKSPVRLAGPPHVLLLDLAIVRSDPVTTQYIAACADPWPGALAVVRSLAGSFETIATLPACATIGETLDALGPGPTGRFDRGASLRVRLYSGELASVGDALALEGRAVMAIRESDGAWEVFAFARAELVASRTYRLSRLLRGLGGEEALAARSVPAGAQVVLLDRAVVPLSRGLSTIGVVSSLRVGPTSRDPGDEAYVSIDATPTSKALLPYAPVGARATSSAAGVVISFIRRGRIESDAWEPIEIPLGEDSEAYQIEIARPSGAPRIIMTASQSALYAAGDIAADFATPPATLDLTIRQVSMTAGPGFPLTVHVPVQ